MRGAKKGQLTYVSSLCFNILICISKYMKLTGIRENNKSACADEKKETIEREIQAESSFYDSYFNNHKDQKEVFIHPSTTGNSVSLCLCLKLKQRYSIMKV